MNDWKTLDKCINSKVFKLYNLNDAVIDYGRGYVYKTSNSELLDMYRFQGLSYSKFLKTIKKNPTVYESAKIYNLNDVIFVPLSINFYHMMIDCIPRLYASRLDSRPVVMCQPILDVIPKPFEAVKKWFQNVEFNLLPLHEPYLYSHAFKERLIGNNIGIFSNTATNPIHAHHNNRIFAVAFWKQWYREHFTQQKQDRKIFIYRESSTAKRLINQEELFLELKKQGFEKINPNNLTLEQTATIMNSAKIVIGAHGAGLTNAIFCQPNTQYVQIANSSGSEIFYEVLAKIADADYRCIYGRNPTTDVIVYSNKENFIANINEIMALIKP